MDWKLTLDDIRVRGDRTYEQLAAELKAKHNVAISALSLQRIRGGTMPRWDVGQAILSVHSEVMSAFSRGHDASISAGQ